MFRALLYVLSASDCFFVSAAGSPIAGDMKLRLPMATQTIGVRRSPRARAAVGEAAILLIAMAISQSPGFTGYASLDRKRRMHRLARRKRARQYASARAARAPDVQISKNLSSPRAKNIPLTASGKSALLIRPSHPTRGAARDRHETRGGMRWTRRLRL